MAYLYDVPNATEGIDNILVTTQASVHIFIPMVLFFIWGVIFMSGVLGQKKRVVMLILQCGQLLLQ